MLNKEKKDEDLFVSGNAAKPIVVGSLSRPLKFRLWNPERNIITGGNELNTLLLTTDGDFVKEFNKCKMVWMPFTGFKDIAGKEIYEGDILSLWYSRDTTGKDIVKFNHTVEWEDTNGFSGWNIPFLETAEIIGNVFENPEN